MSLSPSGYLQVPSLGIGPRPSALQADVQTHYTRTARPSGNRDPDSGPPSTKGALRPEKQCTLKGSRQPGRELPAAGEVHPGLEPGLPLYERGVPPQTPADRAVIPDGLEPSFPGCDAGVFAAG